MKKILIKPHITEKTIELTKQNKYTFQVSKGSRKPEIKQAVESTFGVKVLNVKITTNAPEVKRNYKYQANYKNGGIKKAVVKLKKGQKIELFDLEESK